MKRVRFVPKLFLPLALLTMSAAYAMGDASQAPTEEQIAAQQQMFNAAGDQLASYLLQDPALAAWFNDASDDEVEQFNALCVQYAALNIIARAQFTPSYNQVFNALTDLTGRSIWSVQISFMSDGLAQALQAQQAEAAAAAAAAADDSDDSEDDQD